MTTPSVVAAGDTSGGSGGLVTPAVVAGGDSTPVGEVPVVGRKGRWEVTPFLPQRLVKIYFRI